MLHKPCSKGAVRRRRISEQQTADTPKGTSMSDIIAKCRELNQMLKDSEEYRKYVIARKNLRSNKDLYNRLKELKKINSDIHNYSGDNRFDDLIRMIHDYDDFLHNSVVSDFLRAESRLSELVQEMYSEIAKDIYFDLVVEDE